MLHWDVSFHILCFYIFLNYLTLQDIWICKNNIMLTYNYLYFIKTKISRKTRHIAQRYCKFLDRITRWTNFVLSNNILRYGYFSRTMKPISIKWQLNYNLFLVQLHLEQCEIQRLHPHHPYCIEIKPVYVNNKIYNKSQLGNKDMNLS